MSEEKKDFLKIEDLEVIYTDGKKTVQAVNHVSFGLKKGETLALVGETGAGKTTIAKAILRILPDPPAKMLEYASNMLLTAAYFIVSALKRRDLVR